MTTRALRLLSTSSITAGIALFIMSCSLLPQRQVERGQANRAAQRAPAQHIAQINFGRDASFAVCIEPACPSVTRKSLAVTPDTAALPTATPTVNVVADPATMSNADAPQPLADRTATEHAATSATEQHQVIVQFMPGRATLTSSGKAVLAQSLPYARKASRIVISGRTDNTGADDPNQSLALARALNVRDYLRRREPTLPAVMAIEAKGRCCFIASNDTPQGRRQNRRVEVVFNVPEQVTR